MNRTEFLDLGVHCSDPSCHQLDFLPFKCPCCTRDFCSDHWRPPQGHQCALYDAQTADNRIPSCPLCNTPISFPTSTDPNIAMDQHLSTTCPTLHPHLPPKPKAANLCAERKCKVKMIVPIACAACGSKFCPQHRFEGDHGCKGKPPAYPEAGASGGGGKKGFFGASSSTAGAGKATTSQAGLAALRRAQAALKPSTNAANASAAAPRLGSTANPIVVDDSEEDSEVEIVKANTGKGVKALASVGVGRKVDKRALAEQESQRKGLEARAKKGLLTEDEKVRYATLKALEVKKGGAGGKEGCEVS